MPAETVKKPEVTPAFGMRKVGGFGLRGWRVHCPSCGHLSEVIENSFTARARAVAHRCQ